MSKSLFGQILPTIVLILGACASPPTGRAPASKDLPFTDGQIVDIDDLFFSNGIRLIGKEYKQGLVGQREVQGYPEETVWKSKRDRLGRRVTVGSILDLKGKVSMKDGWFWMDPIGYDSVQFPLRVTVTNIQQRECDATGETQLTIDGSIGGKEFSTRSAYFLHHASCEKFFKVAREGLPVTLVIPDAEGKWDLFAEKATSATSAWGYEYVPFTDEQLVKIRGLFFSAKGLEIIDDQNTNRYFRYDKEPLRGKKRDRLARRMSVGSLLNLEGRVSMKDGWFWMDPIGYDSVQFPLRVTVTSVAEDYCGGDDAPQLKISGQNGQRSFEDSKIQFNHLASCRKVVEMAKHTGLPLDLVVPDAEGEWDLFTEKAK